MIDNQILISTHRQARLEAAQAAFFQSGGKVEEVAGFEFRPKPPRKHPEPGEKKPKGIHQRGARLERSKQRSALIAEMAKTMTCREVSAAVGMAQTTLWTMAQREEFKFLPDTMGKPNARSDDAKLIERITALRDVGLTRHQVEKQMGIGSGTLRRIIDDYDIDFPKFRNRMKSSEAL
jgi:hypothetical protein